MTLFIIGVIAGVIVGGFIGIVGMAMVAAGRNADLVEHGCSGES